MRHGGMSKPWCGMMNSICGERRRLRAKDLSAEEFTRARVLVYFYLAEHKFIANRDFRELTHHTYDQAVTFFNTMVAEGFLVRSGKTTSTRYSLNS